MIDADVLVVGGGPAGSSLAFALARAGVDVHVVDRARFPRPKPCAEYLSPEASRILVGHGCARRDRSIGRRRAGRNSRARAERRGDRRRLRRRSTAFAAFAIADSRCDAKCSTRFCSIAREPPARASTEGVRVTGRRRATRPRSNAGRADARAGRTGRTSRALRRSPPTDCARSSPSDSASRTRCAGRVDWRSSRTTRRRRRRRARRDARRARRIRRDRRRRQRADDGRARGSGVAIAARSPAIAPRFSTTGSGAHRISRRASRAPTRATPVVATGPIRVARATRLGAGRRARRRRRGLLRSVHRRRDLRRAPRRRDARAVDARGARRAQRRAQADARSPQYDAARRKEFGGKWIVERSIGAVVGVGAADQPRRARSVGAKGSRRSAHRRDRQLRSGARDHHGCRYLWKVSLWPSLVAHDPSRAPLRMIDADTFRSVLGRFASGVTIVTARDDDGDDHGMTVSAFCSLSLEPPLVLICVDHAASMHELLLHASDDSASAFSHRRRRRIRAGSPTGRRTTASTASRIRAARTASCCSTTRSRTSSATCSSTHDAGDHTIFIAEVDRAEPQRRRTTAAVLSRRLRAARAMTLRPQC